MLVLRTITQVPGVPGLRRDGVGRGHYNGGYVVGQEAGLGVGVSGDFQVVGDPAEVV